MRRLLLALGLAVVATTSASAQVWIGVQNNPTLLSNGPCPTSMNNMATLPAMGMLCMRTDTNPGQFFVYQVGSGSAGSWQQVTGANLPLTSPVISGAASFGSTISVTGLATLRTGAIFGAPVGSGDATVTPQVLQNDLVVMGADNSSVAPAGPLVEGATFRIRSASFFPLLNGPVGTCVATLSAGDSFNSEWPILLLNPKAPFIPPTPFVPAGTLGCE